MLLAAEKARSLLLPMTKLSIVYLGFRPVLFVFFELEVRLMEGFLVVAMAPAEISRGRTLLLVLVWTSNSTDLTSTLLFLRASVIISR